MRTTLIWSRLPGSVHHAHFDSTLKLPDILIIMLSLCLQIRSDVSGAHDIVYSLEGVGADKHPFHVFSVGHKTGLIRVHQILDREEIAVYKVISNCGLDSGLTVVM